MSKSDTKEIVAVLYLVASLVSNGFLSTVCAILFAFNILLALIFVGSA